MSPESHAQMERDREYHERLYAGSAQSIFSRPAVRRFRRHLAARILSKTRAASGARLLSVGCGIGDTEILLAPHVRHITAVDLSENAVRQARADAERAGVSNVSFLNQPVESLEGQTFDAIIGIFLLHHLPEEELRRLAAWLPGLLPPGGVLYFLDPSLFRLSGAIGSVLIPGIVRRYQSPAERPLHPARTAAVFRRAGFSVELNMYDFCSTPFAGLFPGWEGAYVFTRALDDVILRVPGLRRLGSNFEMVCRRG